MGGPSRCDKKGPVTEPERHPIELVGWLLIGLTIVAGVSHIVSLVLAGAA